MMKSFFPESYLILVNLDVKSTFKAPHCAATFSILKIHLTLLRSFQTNTKFNNHQLPYIFFYIAVGFTFCIKKQTSYPFDESVKKMFIEIRCNKDERFTD